MQPDERLAVIDLGSNSFRLVVFMAGEGWWRRTDEIYEPVRIGEGLLASGRLGERADASARSRRSTCSPTSAAPAGSSGDAVDAVATSAIRDADNARGLPRARARALRRCRSACSAARQEARYGYLAAVNSTTLERRLRARPRRRLDAARRRRRPRSRATRARGGWARCCMSERFLPPNGPAKRRQLEELREHVASELARRAVAGCGARGAGAAPGRHRRHRAQPRGRRAARGRAALQRRAGHGDRARGARRAGRAPGRAAGGRARERAGHQARARRPDPRGRAWSSQGVLQAGGFDGLETTEAGLREGVFFERLLAAGRRASAAVRGRAPRERAEHGGAVPRRRASTPDTSRSSRSACSTSSPRSGCTRATRASASCCGRRACCTTSACRSTTTTTTSTRAT